MKHITIDILDFSDDPWGRDATENPISNGEKFRNEFLINAFKNYDDVTVDFSKLETIPDSSFLGESFVGLVKKEGFSYDSILKKLTVLPSNSIYSSSIEKMLRDAKEEDINLGLLK